MDLSRLKTLRELALRGTMAAVADALRISPSAVSQQIALLEAELDITLVERRGRGVRLTPAGNRLVAHAERITGLMEEASSEIDRFRAVVSGELHIAAFPSIASSLVPRLMQSLTAAHPQLMVVLQELEPDDGLAALRSWQVDVAFVDDQALEALAQRSGLEAHPVLIDESVAMLPRSHPLARQKTVSLEQLKNDRWALDVRGAYGAKIIEACTKRGFEPQINGNCAGFPSVAAMVTTGCSVSVMPSLRVRQNPGDFHVARLVPTIKRHIYAVHRKEARGKPSIGAILAEMRRLVALHKFV